MIRQMFAAVLTMTPWTALLILLLMLLRRAAGHRLSPRFFQLAFLLLALRLALPVDFSLPDAPVQVELPGPAVMQTQPVLQQPELPLMTVEPDPVPHPLPVPPEPEARGPVDWASLLPLVWLTGAAGFLLFRLAPYGAFCLRTVRTRRPAEEEITKRAGEMFGHPVRVFLLPGLPGPMLAGLVRPAVYLPEEGVRPEALPFVLAHEACHARRHDLAGQFLLLAAQSVHWFDPLVHLMARLAREDMERGCDEAVLSGQDLAYRRAYGSAVLDSLRRAHGKAPALSTGFTSGSSLKRRFTEMFDVHRKSRGKPLLALLLAAVLAASTLVACTGQPADPAPAAASAPAPSAPPEPSAAPMGGDWGWPLAEGTEFEIARTMNHYHRGMDINADKGTPIYALFDGTVLTSQTHYSYGECLIIADGTGREVLYAHCDARQVQAGEQVTAGQQVATVGNTGDSTGYHLHVETILDGERQPPRETLTLPAGTQLPPEVYDEEAAADVPGTPAQYPEELPEEEPQPESTAPADVPAAEVYDEEAAADVPGTPAQDPAELPEEPQPESVPPELYDEAAA